MPTWFVEGDPRTAPSVVSTPPTVPNWDEVERLEPLEGDRVLAWLTLHLETQGSYQQRQPITNLYELEDGRLSRVRVFWDRSEALEAAGLSE